MKKLLIILFLCFPLLTGCSILPPRHTPPSRIVSYVDIYCQLSDGALTRHYTDPGKIESVLHYVRLLDPNGPVQLPPEALEGDYFRIVVHLRDGGTRTHQQRADAFAALHHRYWGRIDRSLGTYLQHIIRLLPSDPLDANDIDIPQKMVTKS